jgi:heat shock protein HslJ
LDPRLCEVRIGGEVTGTALERTRWTLVELGGLPVEPSQSGRDPHLVLEPDGRRLSGSGGCNRLLGSYELDGDRLGFGAVATTMMACPEPLMRRERAFIEALEATMAFRIAGETLELLVGDELVARLAPGEPE